MRPSTRGDLDSSPAGRDARGVPPATTATKESVLTVGLRRLATMQRVLENIRTTAPERSVSMLEREIRHQQRLNEAMRDRGL